MANGFPTEEGMKMKEIYGKRVSHGGAGMKMKLVSLTCSVPSGGFETEFARTFRGRGDRAEAPTLVDHRGPISR